MRFKIPSLIQKKLFVANLIVIFAIMYCLLFFSLSFDVIGALLIAVLVLAGIGFIQVFFSISVVSNRVLRLFLIVGLIFVMLFTIILYCGNNAAKSRHDNGIRSRTIK